MGHITHFMKFLPEFMENRADKENGYFLTMNPGYAGRTKFTLDTKHWKINNMDTPDFLDISQLLLARNGFHNYEEIGTRFERIRYELRWKMTKTDHYDFGMRMVMHTVKSAGRWLLKTESEEQAMLSALMVSIYPGIRYTDFQTFEAILNKSGFNSSDFKWPKNEKAVHPTCEPQMF